MRAHLEADITDITDHIIGAIHYIDLRDIIQDLSESTRQTKLKQDLQQKAY